MNVEEIVKESRGTVVDVRSQQEYMGGSAEGSINIPLNEVPDRIEELKTMSQPLVLCCASGNRSGQAMNYLQAQGMECHNGGSWLDVNHYQSQSN